MSVIDNVKEIADLIKKIGDIELYRKIVELEGELIELTRENRSQQEKIEELQEVLKIKGKMAFRKPFYYMEGDSAPYCPRCWEVERITVHLHGPTQVAKGPRSDCPNCSYMIIDK